MSQLRRVLRLYSRAHEGSALLLVLFVCLAVTVAIQTLATVVVCAERALHDESVGRSHAFEKNEALAGMRSRLQAFWRPLPWAVVIDVPYEVEARAADLDGGLGWVMRVDVRQPLEVSRMVFSAWAERGRDGIDLPLAALVATRVILDPDRVSPWLEIEDSGVSGAADVPQPNVTAAAYLVEPPTGVAVGEACVAAEARAEWRLDDGWKLLGRGCAGLGPGVVWVSAGPGETVDLPEECDGQSANTPVLAMVSGGGDLDLRELGDLYGVVVVDGGSLLLEGTVLHGAAFVTESATLGARGILRYSQPLLRWATDRSLCRVRLLPGSRWEGTE